MSEGTLNLQWTARPARLDDAAEAAALFNARSQHYYGTNQSTEEGIRAWLTSPKFDVSRDTHVVLGNDGRMLAWGNINNPGHPYTSIFAGLSVAVDVMGHAGLWDEIVTWCECRAREFVPLAPPEARVCLTFLGLIEDTDRWAAVERLGAQRVRISNRMRIDMEALPEAPAWPQGIVLRPFEAQRDLPGVAAAVQEAFRDHWGHVERPLENAIEDWKAWIDRAGESFDAALCVVAMDGEEMAGVAMCEPSIAGDESRGYVEVLAVRRPWRKRGLGLALLHQSFRVLYERGRTAAELDMDSESLTGALRLYEKAGMHTIQQQYTYEKELRPGIDLATRELGTSG